MTKPNKQLILPAGSNLHRVIERAVRAGRTCYNYMNVWRDVNGIGVQLANVDWLPQGKSYINGIDR